MEMNVKSPLKPRELPSNLIRILEFRTSGNRCCSKKCIDRFYKAHQRDLSQFGEDLDSCSHDVKEAALLMNLREHLYNPVSVCRGGARRRQRVAYSVFPFGRMCRCAYLLLWNIGVTTLKDCLAYMRSHHNTFRPRIHGRSGRVSPTALSADLRQQVVQFVLDLAKTLGEASEGRQGRRNLHTADEHIVYFLPAPWSVARLYRQFLKQYRGEHPGQGQVTPLSFSAFRTIFYSAPCHHIRIRSPRSAVCDECALYRGFYRQQPEWASPEAAKADEEKIHKWQAHLQLAKDARLVYNHDITQARTLLHALKHGELEREAYVAHYTCDFMQNLAIPQFADMTQNLYFLSLRKLHVFSIRDDGEGAQVNYLYDEGDGGKGANYVISMLWYFLCHRPRQVATLTVHLHADNCCGQNKNNMVMQFFVLIVSIGFLTHAELKFMIRGHTHCTVDGGHGILKKAWRRHDVFTIDQAAQVIRESSPVAGTHAAVILRPEHFFDWEHLLSRSLKKLPHLLSFQEFEMDAVRPGVLRYREHQEVPWQATQLFKKGTPELSSVQQVQDSLTPLKPPGMTEERQRHLYEKVRKYVPEEFQESVCPKPSNYHTT